MRWLLYLRLVTLTAGTLLPFFWMVVILGHRRQRNFERIFFFLCLALTCFFGSSLLALNAQLYYGTPPQGLLRFSWTVLSLGLWFIPPLVLHLHIEYASLRELLRSARQKHLWLAIAWLPAVVVAFDLGRTLRLEAGFDFERPTHLLGLAFQVWLALALIVAAVWQVRFRAAAPDHEQRAFHRTLAALLVFLSLLFAALVALQRIYEPRAAEILSALLAIFALLPLGILIGNVQRFNFLQIGRQRNLIYAVISVFLALLYLSFVRRAGQWLEPILPPEATAALLLFLPVVFFEPLQRLVGRALRATARREMEVVYRLSAQIQREARQGDLLELIAFIEQRVKEEFEFEDVWLNLLEPKLEIPDNKKQERQSDEGFSIYRPGRLNGVLTVRPHGAMLSGEVVAAMQFLCEGIAGSIDLCIVLEEKLQLERELAERERMALVGQMAASISHNLKNPLGSIKTILQVQMESPELPASLRRETQMVLDEINRLSAKLNQLLQFSRPGLRSTKRGDHCNVVSVAANVVEVLRHEAEPGGVSLEFAARNGACEVAASGEAVNDILSNVVLNAIEAVGRGGHVRLGLHCEQQSCTVTVEDDGPGIPAEMKEKILRPFFTTKARGTGLGLAIVARRLEEIGGALEIDSPIREERGSRFRVILPLAPKEKPS
ncbi:MAG TPA: ATP-binding protein [Candidatus Sulfotelmatobacter sp.]|nr:ATP-binding protein [Candidatus Sulfotelmatobacter sp.]